MKISNDVVDELKKIRSALDNMYDELDITLFDKKVTAKTTYQEVKPCDRVSDNFEYIAEKLKFIESSEVVED